MYLSVRDVSKNLTSNIKYTCTYQLKDDEKISLRKCMLKETKKFFFWQGYYSVLQFSFYFMCF